MLPDSTLQTKVRFGLQVLLGNDSGYELHSTADMPARCQDRKTKHVTVSSTVCHGCKSIYVPEARLPDMSDSYLSLLLRQAARSIAEYQEWLATKQQRKLQKRR